ncbi:MAG: serine hydrolase domain-containing protein [Arenicella sp.]
MESDTPLTNDSLFYLASESKQFTASCILNLVNDGHLTLDSDIRDIVNETRKFTKKITVQNLLNHTSGIPDYLDYVFYQIGRYPSDYFDNKESLELISKFDFLHFLPGDEFDYSNSNYILLMAAVQSITGLMPAQYAREKIFNPVNMRATLFDDDRYKVIKNRVYSYNPVAGENKDYRLELKNSCTVGDGGVLSSINDLALWEANIHNNQCLPDSVVSGLFHTNPFNNGTINYYANGTEISPPQEKVRYSFHGGGFEGFRTLIFRLHDEKLSFIYLSNNPAVDLNKQGNKWPLDYLHSG